MHPTISQYAQALEELTERAASEKVAEIAENFFGFLKRCGEEKKMDAIMKSLEQCEADKENRVSVTVVTAHAATKGIKEKLAVKAQKLFPNKKIAMRYEVDADAIGGALFRTDERLYDVTLAAELKTLKNSLSRTHL